MTEVDMRALARRGAQQTLEEIFTEFPELRASEPPPKPPRVRVSAAMRKQWKVAKANTANNGE